MKIEILPSLLAADYGRLADEIIRAESANADAMHIDIMDPTFVPNMSFGPAIVALCRKVAPNLHRNVHLMMRRPDLYIDSFVSAGAQSIQVHIESDCDLHTLLPAIRARGAKAEIVLNPETPVESLTPYINKVDGFLVMTVHPGYGGQKFIAECLPKVSWLRERCPSADIMIDGGGNATTIPMSHTAGANRFVAGSYLYGAPDMAEAIAALRRSLS